MRWEYSSLSILVWLSLVCYVLITVGLFALIAKNKNKKQSFNLCATALVGIHIFLLVMLGFGDSASSSSRVGLEVWVCGRQVEVGSSGVVSKLTSKNDARFGADKDLVINGEEGMIKMLPKLETAGLKADMSNSKLSIPISRSFELKTSSDSSLAWLNNAIKYSGNSGLATLEIASQQLSCPYGGNDEWNIFVARVNNANKTYWWERVYFNQLATLGVNSSDGGDLPDCVVFDYGPTKATAEYRCVYLLKNDAERCPDADKSNCKYREVTPI